jgi:RecB family exonuclease
MPSTGTRVQRMASSTPSVIQLPPLIAPVPVDTIDGDEEPRVSVPHISFSQMSMYLRCSKQYEFRYIKGLKQRPALPLAIGKGGHSALEYNGRHKMKTGDDVATNDLLDMASDFIDIQTQELEPTDIKSSENVGESKDRALATLRVYRTRDAINITPAGVEIEFNLDLNDDPNVEPIRIINGKIDIITTNAEVEDYKFTSRMKDQNEVDLSPQLTLYGKVFHTLTGKYPANTGFRMFLGGSTRTPPDSRTIYRDAALMEPMKQEARFRRLTSQFRSVERAIEGEVFIPTDDPRTCGWCGYRERCQSSLVDDFGAAKIRGES